MKPWAGVVIAVAGCVPPRVAFERPPGAAIAFDRAAQDPKALAIADQAIAAAGGADAWARVHQLRWTEQLTRGERVLSDGDEAWDRWNGRAYARFHDDGHDIVVKRDLWTDRLIIHAGSFRARDREPMRDRAVLRWRLDTAALCAAFLLEEPGAKLAFQATQFVHGKPADRLAVVFDPHDPARPEALRVIVDQASHRVVRVELKNGEDVLGYDLDGYTTIGGLLMPTLERNEGVPDETVRFTDLAVGEPQTELYIDFR